MNIIEIKNLKKSYGDVLAVDDISFSVKEGDLFAFLGLNGAGKSTTINIMCGALDRDSGDVFIDGYDTTTDMQKIKRSLGVVFQNSILDNNLSVYDNLYTRSVLYGLSKKEFIENLNDLATKLEFKDILNRPLNKLSGGQKRRVDIARALIHKPKLLILDEPTTGLDPKTRSLVWNLINDMRRLQHLTVLLTTHYMEEAADADNVVIIDSGKIVANNTPNELKNQYAIDQVLVYSYDGKFIDELEKSSIEYSKSNDVVSVIVKSAIEARDFIVKYAKHIFDFEFIKGNMDSVFLTITGKELKEY